jgi:tRNA(Ile)-lysidine synthase
MARRPDDMAATVGQLLDRCTFPVAGTPVTCAVSGGFDSMAMLALATAHGCDVTAVHVDHGLRPGSASEAQVVAAAAERFGAGFSAVRAHVEPGPNLEARARQARHAALPPDALLAHTADDQAETVLLHLVRGAGLDGLAGMRAERRPILHLRRSETHRLCADLAVEVVDDPSNVDPAHRRNRVRHELLPLLDDIAERDVVPVIARNAAVARRAVDELHVRSGGVDPTDAVAMRSVSEALAREAVRAWLRPCSPEGHPPPAGAVDRVLAVAHGRTRATEVGGGWRVERHRQRLVLVPPTGVLG